MEEKISVNIPLDEEGNVEYACPMCDRLFRLKTNEFEGENCVEAMYCPYCGLNFPPNEFMPKHVMEYIKAQVVYYEEQKVQEELKRMSRKYKFMQFKPKKIEAPESIHLDNVSLYGITCERCGKEVKIIENPSTHHYCPYCGGIL